MNNSEIKSVPNQSTLIALIDRLDQYPVGLPDTPEIREFLSIFLTADEALLASKFPLRESTADEMAKRVGWKIEKTERTLDGMAEKGSVIDYPLGDEHFWLLTPSVIGFVEFSLMKMHKGMPMKRLAEVLYRYEEDHLWKEVFGSKTSMTRALLQEGVPVDSQVMDYASLVKLVESHDGGSVQKCFCRHQKHLLGDDCKIAPYEETCICLGKSSDFMVRRGFGRYASRDELLQLVRDLGAKGLIQITDNVRDKPTFICNCCGCCCGILAGMNRKGLTRSLSPSPYIIDVDSEKCVACGLCVERCQVHALSIEDKRLVIDKERCLGCGACTQACKGNALSMKKRKNTPHIPKNALRKFVRIAHEKGKLWPLIREAMKSKLNKIL